MENCFFTHFLSHLPVPLSFYTPLLNSKIWGVEGASLDPRLMGVLSSFAGSEGVWVCINPRKDIMQEAILRKEEKEMINI